MNAASGSGASQRKAPSKTAPRSVTVLGCTGSVGCNTIDMIERDPASYRVEALTAHGNVDLLIEQARRLKPRLAVTGKDENYDKLKTGLSGTGIEVAAGRKAVIEAAERPADWVMASIVGAAGLEPTLAAVRRGAMIGLANKETLVCAGALMMKEVAAHNSVMLPVDSEHSAIYQVFDFERLEAIEKIILTASGGPFRTKSYAEMTEMTPAQAVAHPNWSMGAKISVDSASMMNKGLELIEAHYLFDMPPAQLDVLIHPESIVHSLVHYADGSVLAQLGMPDMAIPIAYTLGWPNRLAVTTPRLNLAEVGALHFRPVEDARFPALGLARKALIEGPAHMIALNAANEVAVAAFLDRRIPFTGIADCVARVVESVARVAITSTEEVIEADTLARARAQEAL